MSESMKLLSVLLVTDDDILGDMDGDPADWWKR